LVVEHVSSFVDYQLALRFSGRRALSAATKNNYEFVLGTVFFPWLGGRSLARLKPSDLQDYADYLQDEFDNRHTQNTYLRLVNAFLRWCSSQGACSRGLGLSARRAGILPGVPRMRFLDRKEVATIIRFGKRKGPESHMLVSIAFFMGLRRKELSPLRYSDFQGDWLYVEGKGEKPRQVPIPLIVKKIVTKCQRVTGRKYCFTSRQGGPLTPGGLYQRWSALLKEISKEHGIEYAPMHVARHTAASSWVMAGVDIRTVQSWLGHAKVSTTEIYAKVSEEHGANRMREFEKWFRSH